MTPALVGTIRNNALNQIRNAIDAGSGPGLFRIYSGTRPATGGAETTLLAELTFSDPCAPDATGGVLTFSSIGADSSANAAGTASWARWMDSDTNACVDMDVGTSGTDVILNTTTIGLGANVAISSATVTEGNP